MQHRRFEKYLRECVHRLSSTFPLIIIMFIQYLRVVQTKAWLAVTSTLFSLFSTAVVLQDTNSLKCSERKWFRYCLFSSAQPSLRSLNVLRILRLKTMEVCGGYPPIRFSCCFVVLKPFLCEGALRHRNTRELYSNNLRAFGPKHAQLKTKQNRKQQNKKKGSKQGKQIINQNIHVLAPLDGHNGSFRVGIKIIDGA